SLARRRLFGVLDPADELIAAQRRQVSPQVENLRVRPQGVLKVEGRLMHGSLRKTVWHGQPLSFATDGSASLKYKRQPDRDRKLGACAGRDSNVQGCEGSA